MRWLALAQKSIGANTDFSDMDKCDRVPRADSSFPFSSHRSSNTLKLKSTPLAAITVV